MTEQHRFQEWSRSFLSIASIGENKTGGIDRLAFTSADLQARAELLNRAAGLQLQTKLDNANNLWMRQEGTDPSLPPLLMGSHMDTVPNGGRYDGALGVLAGLHVLKRMFDERLEHRRPIELIVFACEESSRFNLSTIGSKLLTGQLKPEQLENYKDGDGISAANCLSYLYMSPYRLRERQEHLRGSHAFLELHIEQGPVLERTGTDIGVVECIAAPIRLYLKLTGRSDHSGACPMGMRQDALAAAAQLICAIEELGQAESVHKTVATATKCMVANRALNVVPGEAELYVDIRGICRESMERVYAGIGAVCRKIKEERGVDVEERVIADEQPVQLDPELGDVIARNCGRLGLSWMKMPSGAGHDAMNIAKVIPSAMIFIPCINGISHNPAEDVHEKDLNNGLEILYSVVRELSQ